MPTFSVSTARQTAPQVVRVTFSRIPRAANKGSATDALNPANYHFVGPGQAVIEKVVPTSGDGYSIDVWFLASLAPGSWTVEVSNIKSASLDLSLTAPRTAAFTVSRTSGFLSQGVVSSSPADVLRRHLSPHFRGRGWDALLSAIAHADRVKRDSFSSALDAMFLSSATGGWLTKVADKWGIRRPADVGMEDALFRRFAISTSANKLTIDSLMEALEIFYGSEQVRAHTTSTLAEPYTIAAADELQLVVDGRPITAVFAGTETTALECSQTINQALRMAGSTGWAEPFLDRSTSATYVRIYSGARGQRGFVQLVGGLAQNIFGFPSSLGIETNGVIWTISVPEPGTVRFSNTANNLFLKESASSNLIYPALHGHGGDWAVWNTVATADTADTLAPDGSQTATKVVDTALTGFHYVRPASSVSFGSRAFTVSVYAKAGTASWISVAIWADNTSLAYSWFDLATGTVGTVGAAHIASIRPVGDGWYRCMVYRVTTPSSATGVPRIQMATGNGLPEFVGSAGTRSVYLWGLQVEDGNTATSLIRSTTDTLVRPERPNTLRSGDRVLVNGAEFDSLNQGFFEVKKVFYTLSETQYFEIENPWGVAEVVTQASPQSLSFHRFAREQIDPVRSAVVFQDRPGSLKLRLPTTTRAVARELYRAAYTRAPTSISITSASRDANGLVSVTTSTAHGLATGRWVWIDSLMAAATSPGATGGGNLNGLFRVVSAPTTTTFTYQTKPAASAATTAVRAGGLVTPVRTASNPTPTGPYTFDPTGGVGLTKWRSTSTEPIDTGRSLHQLGVADATRFADQPGWLVLNYGYDNQTIVPYLGRAGTAALRLDPRFRFPRAIETGATVTLARGRGAQIPARPAQLGAFYATAADAGLLAAHKTVEDVAAGGIDLDIEVAYPGTFGLGHGDEDWIWGK